MMNRNTNVLFLAIVLLTSSNVVLGIERAVSIKIGSSGIGIVGPTIASVRQIIGHAIGNSVIDDFIVIAPKEDGPIFIEGGLTACAEAGFGVLRSNSQPTFGENNKFEVVVNQLRSIRPGSGVFLEIQPIESCKISTGLETTSSVYSGQQKSSK